MIRQVRGLPVTGPEYTLLWLAHELGDKPLEIACEDYFDFAFEADRTILETNGRRWHDDPTDYEHDHDKWSVPGRHGYRIVFATWDKVTHHPEALVAELLTTLAAPCERLAR